MDCKVHRLVADVALFAEGRVFGRFALVDQPLGIVAEQAGLALPTVRLDAVESFGNGFWHLVFHYRAELHKANPVSFTGNVAEAEWFSLESLPEASEVAHEGWALDVLSKMTTG